jgi:hypothetical protein
MRKANPHLDDDPTHEAIEAELGSIIDTFVERWLGPSAR